MVYIFIILCAIMQVFSSAALGVSFENISGCLTYQLYHANWLHFAINMLCLVYMFNPIRELFSIRFGYYIYSLPFFLMCYAGSTLAGLVSIADIPTVGASGIVFYLLGLLFALKPAKTMVKNYIIVSIAIIIQIICGHSNVTLHLSAMMFGILTVLIAFLYEYSRVHRRK